MEMAREMQESMLGNMGNLNINDNEEGGEGGAAPRGPPGMPGMPGMPAIDPEKYMQAMQRVMGNPEFLQAAESLGRWAEWDLDRGGSCVATAWYCFG
jgi:hypothetical protein